MTTVISRVYADQATADKVVGGLKDAGFPDAQVDTIKGGGNDTVEQITAARVTEDDAKVYAGMLKSDETLVVVRALITPFGAARRAIDIMDDGGALPAAVSSGERYIREEPDMELYREISVWTNHPFMAMKGPLGSDSHRVYTAMTREKLLKPHKTKKSVMSDTFLFSPAPHVIERKTSNAVIRGGKRYFYNPKRLG